MTTTINNAFDYLSTFNRAAAREYVRSRAADAIELHKDITSEQEYHGPAQLSTRLYHRLRIVQDLSLTGLNALGEQPAWGELHLTTDQGEQTFTIEEYPQLLAFVLARYW